jgi:hypothetical protein
MLNMPLRTKIDIDANPGDFQASVAALNKYRDVIQKSSSQWVKYGTSVRSALKTASEMTAHLQQHSLTLDHVSSTQRRFGDAARSAGSIFANMARNTGSIANNLARSATSLFDIFTITGAIGALAGLGGGLFGLEALARGVTSARKGALGLGVDYGRMSAFELNFGRFGDAAAMLGATSAGLYDVTSPAYVGLLASGVSPKGGDAADKMVELMKRLPKIFAGTPEGLIGPKAEALGLTEFWKLPEIIRMLHSPDELNDQIGHYNQDKWKLALSPEAQLAWANFDTALASASLNIGTVLADQLVPLSEPLQHLSKSFVDIVDTFAHSQPVGDALKAVEGDLEWFAGNVGSPEFKAAAGRFLEGVNQLAPFMKSMAHLAGAVGRIGLLGVRVAGDKTYNPSLGEVVGKSANILRDYLHSEARPVTQEGKYLLRMRAAHSNFEYGLLHNVYEHEKAKEHLGVYDDPSIRARQKMKRPQTTSYLDQFQGLRDTRQIIVSDQTHNNVVISSA